MFLYIIYVHICYLYLNDFETSIYRQIFSPVSEFLPIQVKQLAHAAPTTGACVDPTEVVVVVAESRTSPGA